MSFSNVSDLLVDHLENQTWNTVNRLHECPWAQSFTKVADDLGWGLGDRGELAEVVFQAREALFVLRP